MSEESVIATKKDTFRKQWMNNNVPMEAKNAFENYCYLKGHKELCVPLYKDTLKTPRPAVVLGSGSSLNTVLSILKDWKGAIFCSSSQVRVLMKHGCIPDYIGGIDPRYDAKEWDFEGKDKLFAKATYINAPSTPHEQTKLYKGRQLWFFIWDSSQAWYKQVFFGVFPWIKDYILPFTSSAAGLLAIAHSLNYAPLYLIGMDFAGDRIDDGRGNYKEGTLKRTYHGFETDDNHLWSWRGLVCAARISTAQRHGNRWHVYNCSKTSTLIDDFPYKDLRRMILHGRTTSVMHWTRNKMIRRMDGTLARFNTYIFEVHNGEQYGSKLHICETPQDLKTIFERVNTVLQRRIEEHYKTPIEGRRKGFDPSKITLIDIPRKMEYYRKLHEEINEKN